MRKVQLAQQAGIGAEPTPKVARPRTKVRAACRLHCGPAAMLSEQAAPPEAASGGRALA